MNEQELKRCPFCDTQPFIQWDKSRAQHWYRAQCNNADCPYEQWHRDEYTATFAWNDRPEEEALRARLAEIEDEMGKWEDFRRSGMTLQEWLDRRPDLPNIGEP